jgi:hypothetical protein
VTQGRFRDHRQHGFDQRLSPGQLHHGVDQFHLLRRQAELAVSELSPSVQWPEQLDRPPTRRE